MAESDSRSYAKHTTPSYTSESSKVQLNYPLLCRFLSDLRIPVVSEPDGLNILCLEGARAVPGLDGLVGVNLNKPDRYNDCMVLFYRELRQTIEDKRWDGGYRVRLLRVTTEPGRYYTLTKPHPLGAAHLVWGHHLYKPGTHRGKPALVSASGLDRVWRDRDADFSQDTEETVYTGRFGIHVHAGGTGETIGKWSAGCIAVHGGYQGEAYTFLMARVRKHPGRLVNLTLWGGRDLVRWNKDKEGWRPTLRYGIRNSWVADVQMLLNSHLDCRLVADGDWGPKTQDSFLRFQRIADLTIDGICGPLTWGALEDKQRRYVNDN